MDSGIRSASRSDGHLLRASLPEVPAAVRAGRLIDVVGQEAGAEDAVLQLCVLVDVLTARP
ncbi:hypothetical protein [Streptomyces sp. NBC_01190]|uniref:hypothetical protein n=1 Tax=Streptomyces sp. NBC_01190 TaxID=2903767 RepID=UPI00386A59C4|nr:hypothetical protein OG519_28975 [Streptomyces sp. NBC_01190]